jgi:hypothetical protein
MKDLEARRERFYEAVAAGYANIPADSSESNGYALPPPAADHSSRGHHSEYSAPPLMVERSGSTSTRRDHDPKPLERNSSSGPTVGPTTTAMKLAVSPKRQNSALAGSATRSTRQAPTVTTTTTTNDSDDDDNDDEVVVEIKSKEKRSGNSKIDIRNSGGRAKVVCKLAITH